VCGERCDATDPSRRPLQNAAEARHPPRFATFGDLEIDFTAMEAKRSGNSLAMTAQEFKLLPVLCSIAERVISREELFE